MSIYDSNLSLLRKLRFFPRIFSNAFQMFIGGEKTNKPFGLKFEVSAVCNLRCKMCPLSKGLKRKQGILKFENFKKIFDEVYPSYLNLTGIGEPLLNPDLFKIIKYAKAKGTIVKLDTNATLLNKDKIRNIFYTGIDIISISIDSLNKKRYEKIRVGAKFEEVINNLKNLLEYKQEIKSKTKIDINFVIQKENIEEFLEMIEYFDELKVDSINGDIALPLGSNKNLEKREIDEKTKLEILEKIRKIKTSANLNIEHVKEFLEDRADFSGRRKHCFYPWYYPSITWDGNLVPCCYICDNEIVFGNVLEKGFMSVWNNSKIRNFRIMLSKKREGICKDCFIDETYLANKIYFLSKIPLIKKISKINWK